MKKTFANWDIAAESPERLAACIDHTNLKPEADAAAIERLCREAREWNMAAVCVHPSRLKLAANCLQGSQVQLDTVIGFPLGADSLVVKEFAAYQALIDGADEIDMVINMGMVKDGNFDYVKQEINALTALKDERNFILKVIVETANLTEPELIRLVYLLNDSTADYIKTSTGLAVRGVSLQDLQTINAHRSPQLLIKASGGIRRLDFALQLIAAGADRLGCSNGEVLLQELQERLEGDL